MKAPEVSLHLKCRDLRDNGESVMVRADPREMLANLAISSASSQSFRNTLQVKQREFEMDR